MNYLKSTYRMNKNVSIQKQTVTLDAPWDGAASPVYLPNLMAFEACARHLNFTRAAAEIGVAPTAVSRTIKTLEAELQVRLFNRTTRSVSLTESGISLYATIAPALASIRTSLAQVRLQSDEPAGMLRLSTSYVAYRILIEPHIDNFCAKFSKINLEISLDNRLSDIVSAGFDAGIRLGRKLQNGMISVQIGHRQKRVVLASPSYFDGRAEPTTLEELLLHDCIRQRYSSGGQLFDWRFQTGSQMLQIDVQGRLILDEMKSVVDAASHGRGIAYVYEDFVRQELASGALQKILKDHSAWDDAFHIYYPHRKHMPGKLRAFLDFIREANSRP